jgi:Protein of unknown function (DUF3500)
MSRTHRLAAALLVAATMAGAFVIAKTSDQRASGLRMAESAQTFLKSLTDEQRAQATFAYDDPERLNWHYIPRVRKGVPLKVLTPAARAAARGLIASSLSGRGFEQVTNVMSLDDVLFLFEKGDFTARRERRDPLNYSLSIFGKPSDHGIWGWRLEGHHLSLNYTVKDGRVVASTPEFFGANPALVDAGPGRSIRVLAPLEDLARELMHTCSPAQLKAAIVSPKAPKDVWNTNRQQPELTPLVGLAAADMSDDQKILLRHLLGEYLKNMPADVQAERDAKIQAGGLEKIRIGWWGSLERNEKHAYRIQGPTFLIEYNNTQDNANHVHTVWRNAEGDFDQPISHG